MDINACFKRLCEALLYSEGRQDDPVEDTGELIELAEAFLEWIGSGGFKPESWQMHVSWDDMVIGIYWFASEWHEGQASDLYRILSMAGQIYSPGLNSPSEETDPVAWEIYCGLADEFGVETDRTIHCHERDDD